MPATAVTRPARNGPIKRQRMPEYHSWPYCCPSAATPDSAQANNSARGNSAAEGRRAAGKSLANDLGRAIYCHPFVKEGRRQKAVGTRRKAVGLSFDHGSARSHDRLPTAFCLL